MVIDNQYNAAKYRMFLGITLILIAVSAGYYFLVRPRGMDLYLSILIPAIALIIHLYMTLKNYYFVYFRDTGEELTFRYFRVHPFAGGKKSVFIPTQHFHTFEITKKLGGMQRYLVLYQQTNRGVAKYPGISLTGLSNEHYQKLIDQLKQHFEE